VCSRQRQAARRCRQWKKVHVRVAGNSNAQKAARWAGSLAQRKKATPGRMAAATERRVVEESVRGDSGAWREG